MSKVVIKTVDEINKICASGAITSRAIEHIFSLAKVGTTTLELDQIADDFLKQQGAEPAFKGYEGYPYSVVTCINEEVVHGLPSKRTLQAGDILTIDFGSILNGLYSDMAVTKLIGSSDKQKQAFLSVGQDALMQAVDQCIEGNQIGDIGHAIQSVIEKAGYNVIRAFVGHGVGKELHEEPEIPGYGNPHTGAILKSGMVLAVEVMYVQGSYQLSFLEDGWTVITADRSLAAMFEHTVVVTDDKPIIATKYE